MTAARANPGAKTGPDNTADPTLGDASSRAIQEEAPGPDSADTPDGEDMPKGYRRCIATRDSRPMAELLRFVVDPDGVIVPDVDWRLPGRGLWLSPGDDMIEMAARKRLFARAARQPVTVPPDLSDRLRDLLTRRCLDLLGLGRRAGQVVAGYEKVRGRLRDSGAVQLPGVVFVARDGGADGRGKMASLAAAIAAASPGRAAPLMVVGFDAAELGRPLGRERAVHVALDQGRLARSLLESCRLLAGFRPDPMVLSAAEVAASARRGTEDGTT